MSETVLRHRGRGRDENGQLTGEQGPVTVVAIAIAPGGGSERTGPTRAGEDIDCTAYFPPGTDITNADELTVRGKRYPRIVVNDWRLEPGMPGGLEVLCVRRQG